MRDAFTFRRRPGFDQRVWRAWSVWLGRVCIGFVERRRAGGMWTYRAFAVSEYRAVGDPYGYSTRWWAAFQLQKAFCPVRVAIADEDQVMRAVI